MVTKGSERIQITGWSAFFGWAIVGAGMALSFVAMASIGLLVLPVALALFVLASRFLASSSDLLGLVAGVGLLALVVGFINLDYYAGTCPDEVREIEKGTAGCGGLDPRPWFVAGGTFLSVSSLAFGLLQRRR